MPPTLKKTFCCQNSVVPNQRLPGVCQLLPKEINFDNSLSIKFVKSIAAVSCNPDVYKLGGAGLRFWLTGKLGRAWVGAWHWCMFG